MLFLLLLFVIGVFSSCETCLEGRNYVWGVDNQYRMIPNTLTTCYGILSCNYAACALYPIANVAWVIIQPTNKSELPTISQSSKLSDNCSEGPVYTYGLDSNYHYVPNTSNICWGVLSCNDIICTTKQITNVSFVAMSIGN